MGTPQVFATAIVVSVFVCGPLARPQDSPPLAAERSATPSDTMGAPVIDDIAFSGLRRIATQTVKTHLSFRAGEKFDSARIEGDVRELAHLGWFATIRVETQDASDRPEVSEPRHVRLVFYLEERAFLTKVEYCGSRLLSRQQIDKLLADKKLTPRLGEPENPISLHRIADAIQSELADMGHPDARVHIRLEQSSNATTTARFEINVGPHLPVERVSFEGHPEMSAKLLSRQMQRVTPHALFAGLRGRNSYTRAAFEEDRERLLAYYQKHGFPQARIGAARVSAFEENSRRWLPLPHRVTHTRLERQHLAAKRMLCLRI
jgi:outer membrane protein assembly factor BamA